LVVMQHQVKLVSPTIRLVLVMALVLAYSAVPISVELYETLSVMDLVCRHVSCELVVVWSDQLL